jgi:sugar phosphate isomerase/epimerase
MKVGAVSLGWSGTPLPDVFEQIANMGGECVEINSNTQRHHGLMLDSATIPMVRRWAEDAGLEISALSGYCDFAQADPAAVKPEIERLLQTCRTAAEMAVPIVRAFAGEIKPDITLDSVRPTLISAFRSAAREAERLGVTLGIENHGRLINDGQMLAALVDEVGTPNLGFTLDTGNFAWAGHKPVQVRLDLEAVMPHIVNVHIKDGAWTDAGFVFLPAGEGEMPLAWIIKSLTAQGYRGHIHSEFEGQGDFVSGTAASIVCLRELTGAVGTCRWVESR